MTNHAQFGASHSRARHGGQAVPEYALIAFCGVLFVVPALLFLSGNLNINLGNMLSTPVAPKPVHVHSTKGTPSGAIPNVSGLGLGLGKGAAGMNLPTPPTMGLQQAIQTVGVNGATSMLADNIVIVAQQKLAAGEIDQAQYNALIDLSNEGHRQASILGLIENTFLSSHHGQEPYDTVVRFEGKSISIMDLANSIGFDDGGSDPLSRSRRASSSLQRFLDAYQDAFSSGALNDPAIKQQIDRLASQIAITSDSLDEALYDYDDDRIKASELTDGTASYVTDQNSVAICQTGNGADSGHQCQP